MAVPITKTGEDLERAGAVIEALSAASNKYIENAFITQYIEGKVLRDEDSVNMYRLCRRTAAYDRARFYDSTDLIGERLEYYNEIIQKSNSVTLASQYEKVGAKIESALAEMYEAILENQ